ncbi:dihydroxyacetone kinase subunit DhaL [Actinoallomurus sp. CA-150999]|uniref:dihydroxyacetone kinase subunit DhaL n=1 Tax=Actinoallomurus sp. CA-150999 TaxID=3239887 RepID=UPI003D8E85F4
MSLSLVGNDVTRLTALDSEMDIETTLAWVRGITAAIYRDADYLTRLDAAIGDADHGVNMQRGFSVVRSTLNGKEFNTVGEILTKTGTALSSSVGGAAGPLYGMAFRAIGKQLTEPSVTAEQLLAALRAGLEAVQKLGAARLGDKTMIDAFGPAVEAFEAAVRGGAALSTSASAAADAAEEGMRATIPMIARKGRASYLGPRSQGHQDPGATSTALIFRALAEAVAP